MSKCAHGIPLDTACAECAIPVEDNVKPLVGDITSRENRQIIADDFNDIMGTNLTADDVQINVSGVEVGSAYVVPDK